MLNTTKGKYIFISYSHKDTDKVMPIIQKLVADGFSVWYDQRIAGGSEWDEDIALHIDECGCFLAFISKNYLASNNCKDELNYARDKDGALLMVYLENVTMSGGMSMRFSRIQSINKYSIKDNGEFYAKLYASDGMNDCCVVKEELDEEADGADVVHTVVSPKKTPKVTDGKRTSKLSFVLLIVATVLELLATQLPGKADDVVIMLLMPVVVCCIIGKSGLGHKGHRIWSHILFWIALVGSVMSLEDISITMGTNFIFLEIAILVVCSLAYLRPNWLKNIFRR